MVHIKPTGLGRLVFVFLLLTSVFLILYNFATIRKHIPETIETVKIKGFRRPKKGGSLKGIDPLLNLEKGPKGKTHGPGETNRTSATLLSLVRNSELQDMLQSMRELEETWNNKFNYPWTFINDEPFTQEFIDETTKATNAKTRYGILSQEHKP
jgi:mannosyltransferase